MADWVENLHPRAPRGQPGGGRFVAKGGGKAGGGPLQGRGGWALDATDRAEMAQYMEGHVNLLDAPSPKKWAVEQYTSDITDFPKRLDTDQKLTASQQKLVKHLDEVAENTTLPYDMMLHLLVMKSAPEIQNLKPNDVISRRSFMSTWPYSSSDEVVGEDTSIMKIMAPKGSHAIVLTGEDEVVLPRNAKLQFVGEDPIDFSYVFKYIGAKAKPEAEQLEPAAKSAEPAQIDDPLDQKYLAVRSKLQRLADRSGKAQPDKYDPFGDEPESDNYDRTQQLSRYLSRERAVQLVSQRTKVQEATARKQVDRMDKELWEEWKEDSRTTGGWLIQKAVADELEGEFREDKGYSEESVRDLAARYGGMNTVRSYLRAKWETTQWILDKAGIQQLQLYRGLLDDRLSGAKKVSVDLKDGRTAVKFPWVGYKPNGAQSFTTDPGVANEWTRGGEGRYALRALVPRTAAVSIPAFGLNIAEEKEVIVAGTAWYGQDVWQMAPSFEEAPLTKIEQDAGIQKEGEESDTPETDKLERYESTFDTTGDYSETVLGFLTPKGRLLISTEDDSHKRHAESAGTNLEALYNEGTARIYAIPDDMLGIEIWRQPSKQQVATLAAAARHQDYTKFYIDTGEGRGSGGTREGDPHITMGDVRGLIADVFGQTQTEEKVTLGNKSFPIRDTNTEFDSDRLSGAGHLDDDGSIAIYHVTDKPERVEKALEDKDADLSKFGDKWDDLGAGFYGSGAPQIWMSRSTGKWAFFEEMTLSEKERYTSAIREELDNQIKTKYISQSEYENGIRDLRYFATGKSDNIIWSADQPYNIASWQPEFLQKLGIKAGTQPTLFKLNLRGRFVDLTDGGFQHSDIEEIKKQGFDGAYTRGSFSFTPQFVVWNRKAIQSVKRVKKIGRQRDEQEEV